MTQIDATAVVNTIDGVLQNQFDELIATLQYKIRSAGGVATGKTLNSFVAHVQGGNAELLAAKHVFALETGRGPYNGSSGVDGFLENLKEWIQVKGLQFDSDADLERLARFLKWRINKFGTALYQKGGRNDILTPAITAFEDKVGEQVSTVLINTMINAL